MPVVLSRRGDDVVIRVSRKFSTTYGVDESDVVGTPFRKLHWVEEDRDRALEHTSKGGVEPVEVRIRASDDQCRWAQAGVSVFEYLGAPVYLTTLVDIGLKKTAERELEASMAAVREMARFPEMNPGPVARLDATGTVLGANSAARSAFGREALEGLCLWDLVPELDEAVRDRVLSSEVPVAKDVRVGDSWFSLTLAHEPESAQIFVYGTDVSAQKVAEKELEERARFPQMNPGPVARLRRDGTIYRANRAASRVFGREEIRGSSFRDLCQIPDELWERVVTSDQPFHHDVQVGSLWLSFTLVHEPLSDQVFAYGSDVTELKAAQRALAELARFPDMNPGPVLRLDRTGEVVLANRAALWLFDSADLSGRSWLELCPGVDEVFWGLVCEAAEPVAFEATIGNRHLIFHHAPGPEGIFIFVYGSDLTAQKQAESALRQSEKMATLGTLTAGMAHELNNPAAAAQRAAEQLGIKFTEIQKAHLGLRTLRLDQEAARLLEELDRQAREVALSPLELTPLERGDREADVEEWLEGHDVEEPWEFAPALVEIGHTAESLDALQARSGGGHAGVIVTWQAQCFQASRLKEEIRNGSSRLVEIVGAMKAYAYLGQAPRQEVDVNEGLRNTLVILRNKLKQGVEVTSDLDPDLPSIEAYGSDLNQVWTNLLDNAVDAIGGVGRIVIRTGVDDGGVVVEIEDDGPGIPDAIQSRVFDAFFTTKPPGKGTGLGLNTSYNAVVKKHGGTIGVDSVPGRTRFTVRLPLRSTSDAESTD
jgi:signal transduction histidine kinase